MPNRDKNGRFIKAVQEEKASVTNIYEYVSRLHRQHDMPRLKEEISKAAVRRAKAALMDGSMAIDDRVNKAMAILTVGASKLEELESQFPRRRP